MRTIPGWKVDELGLARWIGGRRRPKKECDVTVGRWRINLRRRTHLESLNWVQEIEEQWPGEPCAVVFHCVGPDRWVVIMSLARFHDTLKRLKEIEP